MCACFVLITLLLANECRFSILYEFRVIHGIALQIDESFLTLLQSTYTTTLVSFSD